KVWETPVLKVAQEVGVSDVALAKACRRAKIPLPGRGHWARKERARAKKPKLPDPDQSSFIVEFSVFDLTSVPPRPEKSKATLVDVPDALTDPHVLVQATLKAATKAEVMDGRSRFSTKLALA